jgi:hypothetical protein
MKKILLLSMIAILAIGTKAQDFKKVNTAVLINKMGDAKTEIDKLSIDPKALGKAEYWYFRSKIYAALIKDADANKKYPTLITDVANAIKKLIELDQNFTLLKERSSDAIFDMYSYGFNNGIRTFNDKKWDSAAYYFEYAVTYSDVLFQNKLTKDTKMSFDTTSILYAGYSAQNATKAALACKYYARLADAKVSTDGYVDIYKYLIINLMNDKKEEDFNKYLGIARVAFPKENWGDYEVEYIDRNFSLDQKISYFNKADAAGSMTEMQYLQFGEIFIGVKRDAKEKTKYDSTQLDAFEKKGIEAYKKAFTKNPENAIASYNIGVIYYNNFGLVDDQIAANIKSLQQINSTKPVEKDPKKKAALDAKFKLMIDPILKANQDLEKPINDNLDNAIEWLEKTFAIENAKKERNSTDKSISNKSVDFLANIFQYKRDRLRGKDNKAFDAYDAKYKQYDVLHGKF